MSGIGKIGGLGRISRDTPSSGLDAIDKRENDQYSAQYAEAKKQPRNAKVEEVAKLYEKQFLGEMQKAMRSTITHTDEPSMATNIYQEQLDQQYVDAWGENGGIGLSDMIYGQIMEKYFNSGAGQNLKQQGPVKLTDRDVSHVSRISSQPGAGDQTALRVQVGAGENAAKIQAPWDGKVAQVAKLDGKTALTLSHDSGLRSTFVFDGVPSSGMKQGQDVTRGTTVGFLSPEERSFTWNLKPGPATK